MTFLIRLEIGAFRETVSRRTHTLRTHARKCLSLNGPQFERALSTLLKDRGVFKCVEQFNIVKGDVGEYRPHFEEFSRNEGHL